MKNKIIFILSALLISCKEDNKISKNQESDLVFSSRYQYSKIRDCLEVAVLKNDTLMYNKFYNESLINNYKKELLCYSIFMAEKNNYRTAYYNISYNLSFGEDEVFYNIYKSKYGLYCLLKAYEMGDKQAKETVKYNFSKKGKKIPFSSSVLFTSPR